ncbi:MAG: hypothetical protein FVQ81_07535 [Candidatus Glassbacteria bacterium]|nr:hypothetical protein [Candidatus Glassbacteria bacterium]
MRILSRFLIPLVILSFHSLPLKAEFDLIGNATLSVPTGDLRKYSYGSVGVGGTVRVATNINRYAKVFLQGAYADFGLERGFTRRDNIFSDAALESVTDAYFLSICPGISFGKNFEGMITYFNLAGGINYYSSLSRINSRQYSEISEYMENNGVTWCAGAGAGIRLKTWEADADGESHLIDAVLFDFRFDYFLTGEVEYLDMRTVRYKSNELQYDTTKNSGGLFLINIGFVLKL